MGFEPALRCSGAGRARLSSGPSSENDVAEAGGPIPTEIKLHRASRVLEITFADGQGFRLPCELLRVYSPSAEVRGHGSGQEVLQVGKSEVGIEAIEPVGTYAVKLVFSDGHDTGLYTWSYLHELGRNRDSLWQAYLDRLRKAGASRDATAAPRASGETAWKKL
jgi:DUF971 family protein